VQCNVKGAISVAIANSQVAGDAVSNSNYSGPQGAGSAGLLSGLTVGGSLFNGTTWDRVRSVLDATNSTGTGIAAAGLVGQCDDTSPTAVTENQFGNLRRNCSTGELLVAPSHATITDGSIGLTTGGTSQQVFASNANRRFLMCQNIDASEDGWLNIGATATANSAGSVLLKAGGGSITMDGNFVPTDAINVNAATTGHKFTCKQG
jgi:hypothetical protein